MNILLKTQRKQDIMLTPEEQSKFTEGANVVTNWKSETVMCKFQNRRRSAGESEKRESVENSKTDKETEKNPQLGKKDSATKTKTGGRKTEY